MVDILNTRQTFITNQILLEGPRTMGQKTKIRAQKLAKTCRSGHPIGCGLVPIGWKTVIMAIRSVKLQPIGW